MKELSPKITIKEIRAKYKLNQEQFAESIGVTPQTVSAWEQDSLKISPSNVVKICLKYHVSSDDLYGISNFFNH